MMQLKVRLTLVTGIMFKALRTSNLQTESDN